MLIGVPQNQPTKNMEMILSRIPNRHMCPSKAMMTAVLDAGFF